MSLAEATIEQRLVILERSLHDPAVRSDRLQLDRLIADDFVETGASGVTFGKASVIAQLPDETGVTFHGENFTVRMLAPIIGLVTYDASKLIGDAVRRSKRSSIWVLSGEQWQMVYHQGTLVG